VNRVELWQGCPTRTSRRSRFTESGKLRGLGHGPIYRGPRRLPGQSRTDAVPGLWRGACQPVVQATEVESQPVLGTAGSDVPVALTAPGAVEADTRALVASSGRPRRPTRAAR
jgi:hypothetical protein